MSNAKGVAMEEGSKAKVEVELMEEAVQYLRCLAANVFDWNEWTGDFTNHRRTCGELEDYFAAVVDALPYVGEVRWQGLANHHERTDLLPDARRILTDISLHWHDENPRIEIYAATQDSDGEISLDYLWGIVFEREGRIRDWTAAHMAAGELTGMLEIRDTTRP